MCHTQYPDVVSLVGEMLDAAPQTQSFIIDSEVVAVDPATGELKTFQELSNRARKDVKLDDVKVAVCVFAFDVMYLDGQVGGPPGRLVRAARPSLICGPSWVATGPNRTAVPRAPITSPHALPRVCPATEGRGALRPRQKRRERGREGSRRGVLAGGSEQLERGVDGQGSLPIAQAPAGAHR